MFDKVALEFEGDPESVNEGDIVKELSEEYASGSIIEGGLVRCPRICGWER